MKIKLTLLVFLPLFSTLFSQTTLIPDVNFEDYLETHNSSGAVVPIGDPTSMGNGIANDNLVTTANINSVITLNIESKNIFDLTGIEAFSNLRVLLCNDNHLTSLDVTQNTLLYTLNCGQNQITDLDITQNTALYALTCHLNQLTSLDVTQNTNLNILRCNLNRLTSLDVTQNVALRTLECNNNQLTNLDVTENTLLTLLHCVSNQLTGINVSHNTLLTELLCSQNQITDLYVAQNVLLRVLYCFANQLTSLNLANNVALETVLLFNNSLTSLDIKNGNNTNIATFSAFNNPNLICVAVDDEMYSTINWTMIGSQTNFSETYCDEVVKINTKIVLQGASLNPNTGEENLMRDDLRVNNLIPTTSPYNAANCDPAVFNITGVNAIVDWVFVELRDANDSSIVLDGQSALLQRDGDIVAIDGVSSLRFSRTPDDYFVAVHQRNHLAIVSAQPAALVITSDTVVDFTNDITFVKGGSLSLTTLNNGLLAMYSGDVDDSGQVQSTDLAQVTSLLGNAGYTKADMDMNGQIQTLDISLIITPNLGKGDQVD